MEDDIDTSPGGEYYPSPTSPASGSRNWQEEMEGGEWPVRGGRAVLLLAGPGILTWSHDPVYVQADVLYGKIQRSIVNDVIGLGDISVI